MPVSCDTTKVTLYGELSAVRNFRYLVSTRPAAPSYRVTTIPSQVIREGATASSVAAQRRKAPDLSKVYHVPSIWTRPVTIWPNSFR